MGERKGTNKYYPPDFDPKKHRSLDAYHGTHPLRERAKKLGQGILVIRFEMPYNIWCEGCKNPIGMGVRYNAEKSKIGMYYTTPIYKFRMKCHLCDNYFEIKTDPANHDYVILEGARRKEQRWDPKENEQIVPEDKDDRKKMATDAMYKMEHDAGDKTKSKAVLPGISQIAASRDQWKDDYELNKLLRGKFREGKKLLKIEKERDQALQEKSSLEIDLVPEHGDDQKMAKLLQYRTVVSYDEKQKQKRNEINNRSIFPKSTSSSDPDTPSSSSRSSDSSSGISSAAQSRHIVAHKALSNIVAKRKSPFSLGESPAAKQRIVPKNVGVIRKNKSEKNEEKSQPSKDLIIEEKFVHETQLNTESGASHVKLDSFPADQSNQEEKCRDSTKANALNSLMMHYDVSDTDSD